ncbi:protein STRICTOSIDINE SYNTHASE-LIKE 10-like [Cornus florida]|uniref:protein STRICTOSIDINE SYNTHASE-LIKE 10-like n=1 Tax=Cornus florida TaxID=4283 RepID=UPI0028964D88|nr:protein STRICTOSIDINE SYNTHASE-LIKE 10-like [Cornus florida]XP_059668322.1 protein STRICTOSIDINE SYNTHASE-LIKE 10-like [Cornus florida]
MAVAYTQLYNRRSRCTWISVLDFVSSSAVVIVSILRGKECISPFSPEMEHVCSTPLGLRFDQRTGDLYIADAYLGLQVVGPTGGLATQPVTEVEGQPLRLTNDMDI